MLSVTLINCIVIAIVVIIHYESLLQLSIHIPRLRVKYRFRVAIALIGALIAHAAEVWVFAFAYYFMTHDMSFGFIQGSEQALMDCVYFSFVTYTSLGYGDQLPVGLIRFTAGLEALTGLVLIAMTASFLYFQIEAYWSKKP